MCLSQNHPTEPLCVCVFWWTANLLRYTKPTCCVIPRSVRGGVSALNVCTGPIKRNNTHW